MTENALHPDAQEGIRRLSAQTPAPMVERRECKCLKTSPPAHPHPGWPLCTIAVREAAMPPKRPIGHMLDRSIPR